MPFHRLRNLLPRFLLLGHAILGNSTLARHLLGHFKSFIPIVKETSRRCCTSEYYYGPTTFCVIRPIVRASLFAGRCADENGPAIGVVNKRFI
jgi:hypothetical protein